MAQEQQNQQQEQPTRSAGDRVMEYLKTNLKQLGAQFDRWLAQGAKDLHNAIVPAFPDSHRGVDEPGTPLSPTPQMVTQDLGRSPQFQTQSPQMQAMLAEYGARGSVHGKEQDKGIER